MSTYRDNELGNVLRTRYEEAKFTLEGLAANKSSIDLAGSKQGESLDRIFALDKSLQEIGFKLEHLHSERGSAYVYIRENNLGVEVLADEKCYRPFDVNTMRLYQVPAGQNVDDWYKQIPAYRRKKERTAKTLAISAGIVATLTGFTNAIEPYQDSLLLSEFSHFAIYFIASAALGVAVGIPTYSLLTRKSPLHNQTLAAGPDALRHIANNSEFEAPQSRIESKPRILDAEFTDENATVDQRTYQEQVRESLAVTEEQQARVIGE